MQAPPRDGAALAHHGGGAVRQRSGATVLRVGVLAALLAFGLLGLLVALWQVRRGPGVAVACRACRLRKGLAFAGTFLLAGVVLVGSGMAVHQHATGPGLRYCGTDLQGGAGANPGHTLDGVWGQTRTVLTAPVSGLTRHYVNDRGGGLCEVGSMTMAFLPSAASDPSVAVGSVVLTGDHSSMGGADWQALASHESRHVTQWAALTVVAGPVAMPLLYVADEVFFPGARNHFERAAGLDDGGYTQPDGLGPAPQWAKVGVMGILLVAVAWRRIRWSSRVLAGGAAAKIACQRGLCPLHSRGWFRLQAAP